MDGPEIPQVAPDAYDPGIPWSGGDAEAAVRDLLTFLACSLPPAFGGAGPDHADCRMRLRTLDHRRFNLLRYGAMSNDDARLFADVREALLGTPAISAARLRRFYSLAIPPAVLLPCVVTVRNVRHSWFVPIRDGHEYTSCLHYSDALRVAVHAEALFPPIAGASTAWEDAAEASTYAKLANITATLRHILLHVRRNPDHGGLWEQDRREFLRVTREAIRPSESSGAVVPPSGGPGGPGLLPAAKPVPPAAPSPMPSLYL